MAVVVPKKCLYRNPLRKFRSDGGSFREVPPVFVEVLFWLECKHSVSPMTRYAIHCTHGLSCLRFVYSGESLIVSLALDSGLYAADKTWDATRIIPRPSHLHITLNCCLGHMYPPECRKGKGSRKEEGCGPEYRLRRNPKHHPEDSPETVEPTRGGTRSLGNTG
ncbi:hypothetical protein VUR80DRAFT_2851 [Thermomyces stellatus]